MPTYQYACTECGHQLEAVQSFSDEPLSVCPACEGRLRKVFNSVGVVFKGSGFYRTDSRGKAESTSNGDAAGKTSESSPSESSSSKPAESTSSSSTKSDAKKSSAPAAA